MQSNQAILFMDNAIITGQYVRIEQTPASLGSRLVAFFLDALFIILITGGLLRLLYEVRARLNDNDIIIAVLLIVLLDWLYPLLWEVFHNGQSLGKLIMHLRVVKTDGETPTVGDYLLRWLLLPIDVGIGGSIGLICAILTKRQQRLGDLAAGTMVVRENDYKHIHVSLDEFSYLEKDYKPTFAQAADLSLEQADVIRRTLDATDKHHEARIAQLAAKVHQSLELPASVPANEKMLCTLLRDYQYYALQDI